MAKKQKSKGSLPKRDARGRFVKIGESPASAKKKAPLSSSIDEAYRLAEEAELAAAKATRKRKPVARKPPAPTGVKAKPKKPTAPRKPVKPVKVPAKPRKPTVKPRKPPVKPRKPPVKPRKPPVKPRKPPAKPEKPSLLDEIRAEIEAKQRELAELEEAYRLAEEQERLAEREAKKPKKPPRKRKPKPVFAPEFEPVDRYSLAYDVIRVTAENMAQLCRNSNFDARALIHGNSDGTIDAEVRANLRHGQAVYDCLMAMQGGIEEMPIGCFEQICIIRPAGEDEHVTGKIRRGQRYVGIICTFWVNHRKQRQLLMIVTAVNIDRDSKQRRRRKAEQIVFSWHWNEESDKPERDE